MKVCFRCRQPALATLRIEAVIGRTTLMVSKHAEQPAVCAVCMLELAEWFKMIDQAGQTGLGTIPSGSVVSSGVVVA
jgi:hypothetical protein